MDTTVPLPTFDSAYESHTAPWVIGEPQPVITGLERDGWIGGSVLDAGCGSGEHTIHLAAKGYDVVGIDFAPHAVRQARANAAEQGVTARFEVADALRLGTERQFDTVIDSALFHVFGREDRIRYARGLHAACRPGALVHVLALSDVEDGGGPRISDAAIREAFDEGWSLEDLRPSRYRARINEEDGARLNLPGGARADLIAWLARARRL